MKKSREYLPSQSRSTWIIVACIAGSLFVHGVAYGVLHEIPQPVIKKRKRVEIYRPPEHRKKPKRYKVQLKKRPPPRRAVVPRKAPRPRVVRRFRPMAPPPMAAERPRPASRPRPVLDFTMGAGVNENLTNANGDFAVNTGDSAQGDPSVAPMRVRPRPKRPAPLAPPPPPMRARPVPVYVKVLPRVVNVPRVGYPPAARRLQIEGTVRLSVTVGKDGRVLRVKVLKRLGYGLDEAAIRALKRARFKPAYGSDGRPMVYTIRYRYTFRMER